MYEYWILYSDGIGNRIVYSSNNQSVIDAFPTAERIYNRTIGAYVKIPRKPPLTPEEEFDELMIECIGVAGAAENLASLGISSFLSPHLIEQSINRRMSNMEICALSASLCSYSSPMPGLNYRKQILQKLWPKENELGTRYEYIELAKWLKILLVVTADQEERKYFVTSIARNQKGNFVYSLSRIGMDEHVTATPIPATATYTAAGASVNSVFFSDHQESMSCKMIFNRPKHLEPLRFILLSGDTNSEISRAETIALYRLWNPNQEQVIVSGMVLHNQNKSESIIVIPK